MPPLPEWAKVYAEPFLPLHLDVGSAGGHFLLQMAEKSRNWNFLGLEIRQPLVERANRWKDERGLCNLYFFAGHANVVLKPLLESLPIGVLQYVSINFPDPWFKKRHHKRRLVNPEFVQILATYIHPGGKVFVQTDIQELHENIYETFTNNPHFEVEGTQLEQNPFGIMTEREISVLRLGRYVYRTIFIRKSDRLKEDEMSNN